MTIAEAARRAQMNVNTASSIIKSYNKNGDVYPDRRGGRKQKKLTQPVFFLNMLCLINHQQMIGYFKLHV